MAQSGLRLGIVQKHLCHRRRALEMRHAVCFDERRNSLCLLALRRGRILERVRDLSKKRQMFEHQLARNAKVDETRDLVDTDVAKALDEATRSSDRAEKAA